MDTKKKSEPKDDPQAVKTVASGQPGTPPGPPTDWNPEAKPLDGSPVKTVVQPPSKEPMSGQTGYVPKTVAEHNAEVDEKSADLEKG